MDKILCYLLCFIITISCEKKIENNEIPAFENLVWGDEFNYNGKINDSLWFNQTIPIDKGGWANNELQHYTNNLENCFVKNGILHIVAIKEKIEIHNSVKNYSSARLNSKFDFKYGRIDVKAKLPLSKGTWPAIWTLGSNIDETGNYLGEKKGEIPWPYCGEIDIMEQNGWDKSDIYNVLHFQNSETDKKDEIKKISKILNSNKFNLYSLIWTDKKIYWLLNNKITFKQNITDIMPFDNKHYLLLNLAVGGNLGGSVPKDFVKEEMQIDFVRIFQ
tara:strand:+ start:48 stop:872 length:825 start_codon:yes stop_codon:yes gene_type:complete